MLGRSARLVLHGRQLRSVADKDGADVGAASFVELAHRAREIDGSVPASKRARKDRDGRRRPVEWRGARRVRPEVVRIGAPLDPHNFRAGDPSEESRRSA